MKSFKPVVLVLLIVLLLSGTVVAGETEVSAARISKLVGDLQSDNFRVSLKAQEELAEIGDPSVPMLRLYLNRTRDRWEKTKVVYVLGKIGTEDAVKVMLQAAADDDELVRNAVVTAASNFNQTQGETAIPLFTDILVAEHELTRDTAARALQAIGVTNQELAQVLTDVVINNSGVKRTLALVELGKLGNDAKDVVPLLIQLIDTNDLPGTIEILAAAAKTGDAQVVPVILEILEPMLLSADWNVRQEAIWIMRSLNLKDVEVILPAVELLNEGSEDQQLFAVEVLAHLGITQEAAVRKLIEIVQDNKQPFSLRAGAYSGLESLYSQLEYDINRGLVAVTVDQGVYLGWRLLGTESVDLGFNVYRNGVKINAAPITTSTNYLDEEGTLDSTYYVTAVYDGVEQEPSETVTPWEKNYLAIPLKIPPGGRTPDGKSYHYSANDASVADLDGDGQYEIILKWDPSNSKDNSQKGYTGNVYIDAYKLDGTLMWRIDLGHNIRAGAHYTQFMVYDFDGDGKAEIAMKTADGTVDGVGSVIGNRSADYRNSRGYVLSGPEYLTIFDGETGAALKTVNYEPPRGSVSSWGDSYGNRVDRFLAGVAYLDGNRPSLIMARGYYTRTVVVAYNWRNGELTKLWTFDSNNPGLRSYAGQGNHQLSIGDVDGDGKDEIIYGAMTINHDGTPLYNTQLGHGDALHVGDFDPDRPGLEVFGVHENIPNPAGINLRDARTGEIIWAEATNYDVGRGLIANIDPNYRGAESWASGSTVKNVSGEVIATSRPSINFAVWWDGDLLRELLDNISISKWDWERKTTKQLLYAGGTASNNGTKATPALTADIFGDWREEVILRAGSSKELRIYTTTDLTEHRLYTLMHDRMYRTAVAWQNTAYNQPPHPSFYIGPDMEPQTYNPGIIHVILSEYAHEFAH